MAFSHENEYSDINPTGIKLTVSCKSDALETFQKKIRFCFVVSIETKENLQIYSQIKNRLLVKSKVVV
jgi:hypothetical protein